MSAIGTERLCRPVRKKFRCWRCTGRAAAGPGPSHFDPGCVKTLERSAAVYKFQSIFDRFPPLQAQRSEKIRSRCAVFRIFPSFHTAWTHSGPRSKGGAVPQVVMVALPARSGGRLGSTSSGNGTPSPMRPWQNWTSSGIGISPSHPRRCVRIGRPQSSLAAWRKVVVANRPSRAIPILQHDPVQSLSARRLTNQQ